MYNNSFIDSSLEELREETMVRYVLAMVFSVDLIVCVVVSIIGLYIRNVIPFLNERSTYEMLKLTLYAIFLFTFNRSLGQAFYA